jgi:hypothetical protein
MDKKIRKIEVDLETNDATFFFEDSDEPFAVSEFVIGSLTRCHLANIEYEIVDYNTEVELVRTT